jgi:hypothetical protein
MKKMYLTSIQGFIALTLLGCARQLSDVEAIQVPAAKQELPATSLGEYLPGITLKSVPGNNRSHRFIIWQPPTCRGMEFKVIPSQAGTGLEGVPVGGYCDVLIQNEGILPDKSEKILGESGRVRVRASSIKVIKKDIKNIGLGEW